MCIGNGYVYAPHICSAYQHNAIQFVQVFVSIFLFYSTALLLVISFFLFHFLIPAFFLPEKGTFTFFAFSRRSDQSFNEHYTCHSSIYTIHNLLCVVKKGAPTSDTWEYLLIHIQIELGIGHGLWYDMNVAGFIICSCHIYWPYLIFRVHIKWHQHTHINTQSNADKHIHMIIKQEISIVHSLNCSSVDFTVFLLLLQWCLISILYRLYPYIDNSFFFALWLLVTWFW